MVYVCTADVHVKYVHARHRRKNIQYRKTLRTFMIAIAKSIQDQTKEMKARTRSPSLLHKLDAVMQMIDDQLPVYMNVERNRAMHTDCAMRDS